MKSLIVKSYILPKYFLWAGFVGMLGSLLWAAASGQWLMVAMWLAYILQSFRLLAPGTTVEADAEIIRYSTVGNCWEIKWSEVTKIETSLCAFVLHGDNKTLAMSGTSMWKSEGKEQMLAFIQSQVQAWNIPQQQTRSAAWQGSKNTSTSLPKHPRPPLSQ